MAACTASKTKGELLDAAMERRLLLAPMTTIEDVVGAAQFADRGYFTKPSGDGRLPRELSRTLRQVRRHAAAVALRPPRIGEHTQEILAELDSIHPRTARGNRSGPALPLAGVKILDFMWALAGPVRTRILADWGATVVRVESSSKLDVAAPSGRSSTATSPGKIRGVPLHQRRQTA